MLFTQLQHKDVLMALIAFKSFASKAPVGSMAILDDGSLLDDDRALLREHLPGVNFLDMAEVRSPSCPTRGCWERLLWIARLTRECFVVQLDSDTVTLREIDEVAHCVERGRTFTIGTWDGQEMEPMTWRQSEAARHMAQQPGPHHVQLIAEASFHRLRDYGSLSYVRGCAGFAGFARGSVDLGFIESTSREMGAALGEAWRRWGTEQVMSNIVVANSPGAVVLPHPKYCDCSHIDPGVTSFVHFIGSCRFARGTYQNYSRDVINGLCGRTEP